LEKIPNNKFLQLPTALMEKQTDYYRHKFIIGLKKKIIILSGDIIELVFFKRYLAFSFVGICPAAKRKKFLSSDVSIKLRNIVLSVGIEVVASLYHDRVYNYKLHNYKRKDDTFSYSKRYFLRNRLNRETTVK